MTEQHRDPADTVTMADARRLKEWIGAFAPCLTNTELWEIAAILNRATRRIESDPAFNADFAGDQMGERE